MSDTGMITETEITAGGEVAAEVMTGMTETSIVGGIETLVAVAEAIVQALIILEGVVELDMMMREEALAVVAVGAGVDQWIGSNCAPY